MSKRIFTPDEIQSGAIRAAFIIQILAAGKIMPLGFVKGLSDSHFLCMGEDGGVGIGVTFQNGETHVSDSWTVAQLIRFVLVNDITPLPKVEG